MTLVRHRSRCGEGVACADVRIDLLSLRTWQRYPRCFESARQGKGTQLVPSGNAAIPTGRRHLRRTSSTGTRTLNPDKDRNAGLGRHGHSAPAPAVYTLSQAAPPRHCPSQLSSVCPAARRASCIATGARHPRFARRRISSLSHALRAQRRRGGRLGQQSSGSRQQWGWQTRCGGRTPSMAAPFF